MSVSQCAQECENRAKNQGCRSFAFGGGQCWFKKKCITASEAGKPSSGFKTGYRACDTDGNLQGGSAATEVVPSSSPTTGGGDGAGGGGAKGEEDAPRPEKVVEDDRPVAFLEKRDDTPTCEGFGCASDVFPFTCNHGLKQDGDPLVHYCASWGCSYQPKTKPRLDDNWCCYENCDLLQSTMATFQVTMTFAGVTTADLAGMPARAAVIHAVDSSLALPLASEVKVMSVAEPPASPCAALGCGIHSTCKVDESTKTASCECKDGYAGDKCANQWTARSLVVNEGPGAGAPVGFKSLSQCAEECEKRAETEGCR